MKKLIEKIAQTGYPDAGLTLSGRVVLKPAVLDTISLSTYKELKAKAEAKGDAAEIEYWQGSIEREHQKIIGKFVPVFESLQVRDGDHVLFNLSFDLDPTWTRQIGYDLDFAEARLGVYECEVTGDGKAPEDAADYQEPWADAKERFEAHEEWVSSIGWSDSQRTRRAAFRIFQLHPTYKKNPTCTFEEYCSLLEERTASEHEGISMPQYYAWLIRSQKALGEGGSLTEETRSRVLEMLSGMEGDQEYLRSRIIRNLEVHPRHRELYYRMIEEHHTAKSS